MRRILASLVLLSTLCTARLALAQIGGYFSLEGMPQTLVSQTPITLEIKLEMPAKEDMAFTVGSTYMKPSQPVVIPKGDKRVGFTLVPPYVGNKDLPISDVLVVANSREEKRYPFTVIPYHGYPNVPPDHL